MFFKVMTYVHIILFVLVASALDLLHKDIESLHDLLANPQFQLVDADYFVRTGLLESKVHELYGGYEWVSEEVDMLTSEHYAECHNHKQEKTIYESQIESK